MTITRTELDQAKELCDLGICVSRGEARRFIAAGAQERREREEYEEQYYRDMLYEESRNLNQQRDAEDTRCNEQAFQDYQKGFI